MKVDGQASFAYFVYPFLFDSRRFPQLVRAVSIGPDDFGGIRTKLTWEETSFPHEDVLNHVKVYINPPDRDTATAALWRLSDQDAQRLGLGERIGWCLHSPQRKVPFHFTNQRGGFTLQWALFRVGVGFLTVQACPDSEDVGDWLALLHFFRFINGQRNVSLERSDATGQRVVFRKILDSLLLDSVGTDQSWWQEVFVPDQLLPYAALYVDEVPNEELRLLLYRARQLFPLEREIWPSEQELALDHPMLLSYARQQWFIFSLTGGGFLAADAPHNDFFRSELPDRLARQYFLLFLLAQHQRFALMRLSQLVSEHWLRGDEQARLEHFDHIRLSLLEFTARGYFTQVMQRDQHHRVYTRWQEVLQVPQLYQEVSDEVREMHDILQQRSAERVESRLKSLTWIISFPTLVISFLGINMRGCTAQEGLHPLLSLFITSTAVGIGAITYIGWRKFARSLWETTKALLARLWPKRS